MLKPILGLAARDLPANVADLLDGFATLIQDCVDFATNAFVWCDQAMATGGYHQLTILLLYRHILEAAEATSVLVRASCGEQCQLPLRTALEATMSLEYIFEADTERRALAYQVAHVHKRIQAHTKNDPSTTAGKEFQKVLASDKLFPVHQMRPHNSAAAIDRLAQMLARPEYTPVDQEWECLRMKNPKRKTPPAWHSLFGGPTTIKQMAEHVGMAGGYDVLYSYWSEYIHAGAAMGTVRGPDKQIRSLRDPTGCQLSASLGVSFVIRGTRQMIERYAPARLPEFASWYTADVQARYMSLTEGQRLKVH